MSTLDHLLRLLYHIADGCQSSRVAFDIPEGGFAHLARVIADNSTTTSRTENRSIPTEGFSGSELRYAAEATEAAACAANVAAEAADAAAREASLARTESGKVSGIHSTAGGGGGIPGRWRSKRCGNCCRILASRGPAPFRPRRKALTEPRKVNTPPLTPHLNVRLPVRSSKKANS